MDPLNKQQEKAQRALFLGTVIPMNRQLTELIQAFFPNEKEREGQQFGAYNIRVKGTDFVDAFLGGNMTKEEANGLGQQFVGYANEKVTRTIRLNHTTSYESSVDVEATQREQRLVYIDESRGEFAGGFDIDGVVSSNSAWFSLIDTLGGHIMSLPIYQLKYDRYPSDEQVLAALKCSNIEELKERNFAFYIYFKNKEMRAAITAKLPDLRNMN